MVARNNINTTELLPCVNKTNLFSFMIKPVASTCVKHTQHLNLAKESGHVQNHQFIERDVSELHQNIVTQGHSQKVVHTH